MKAEEGQSPLRGCLTLLEIVFVGQCEVFVCLDFVNFFFYFFPLAAKLIGPRTGCQFFKKMSIFSLTNPLTPKGRVVSYNTTKEIENLIRGNLFE